MVELSQKVWIVLWAAIRDRPLRHVVTQLHGDAFFGPAGSVASHRAATGALMPSRLLSAPNYPAEGGNGGERKRRHQQHRASLAREGGICRVLRKESTEPRQQGQPARDAALMSDVGKVML